MAFEHVLLTRFNVRLTDDQEPPSEEWVAARIRIFSDLCLPSVRRQRRPPQQWFVFFDARTPRHWRNEIERLSTGGAFRPVWLDGAFDARAVNEALGADGLGRQEYLVTTRLDCDDALAPHFTETVQQHVGRAGDAYFINLVLGYQMSAGRFYLRPYIANPFISYVEPLSPGRPWATVFCRPHHMITDQPLVQVRCRPAWLQVIHGRNLSNRVRGIRSGDRMPIRLFHIPKHYLTHSDSAMAVVADQVSSGVRFVTESLRDGTTRSRLRNVIRHRSAD
ncbi:glycosyltransferase [Streptomyces sp. NPDC001165]|uniref:glycosyltransferase n=1 Tax=Streptomyces sp. NPDC001165 TaxID=3364546 RepID=UPI0036B93048